MPVYNNPGFQQGVENLAKLFAPPSGSDAAGWAVANAKNAEARRLADFYTRATAPGASPSLVDQYGVASGTFLPTQSYHAVDMGDATTRRGQDLESSDRRYGVDVGARTSTANNAADNQRAVATNAADNERATGQTKLQSLAGMFGPVAKDAVRPAVPSEIATLFGAPGALPEVQGNRSPLSETELEAHILSGMPLADQRAKVLGDIPVEEIIAGDGKAQFARRSDAVGRTPAPRTPGIAINTGANGVPYGEPEKGTVWARNPDGTVRLDERGAPIAVPYQGGSVYKTEQAAASAASNRDRRDDAKTSVVLQDIDRALGQIAANPNLATGVGAQLTGAIGGSPAYNLNAVLDTVRANVGFDQLQAMRDSSPTGGALGQVTERETALLQSLLGNLQPGQSGAQLTDNLNRLRNGYLDVIHGAGNGPPRARLSFENGAGAATPPAAGGYADGTIIENDSGQRMVRRGGRWEPAR